jgi:hypothetical protein
MTFDIHQLDKLEEFDENLVEEYQDTLTNLFLDSPEGQERAKEDREIGFWAYQFMYYGHQYLGTTLPKMDRHEADEIVTELFPRKISIFSPDEADDTIPELLAFWEYLKREYNLPNAKKILNYLHEIQPQFKGIMNDPSNFGMAKSFFMQGQAAGFDMATEEGSQAFMHANNASLSAGETDPLPQPRGGEGPNLFEPTSGSSTGRKSRQKKKARRKMAKASRKKNRKKR